MSTQHRPNKVIILGTGGTIAGVAKGASDRYTAAVLGVDELLVSVQGATYLWNGPVCVSEQVAQADSKDMGFAIWTALALRVMHHLSQPDVCGLVITHGTDTLEETAYFLSVVLPKHLQSTHPVVLTCAMRPASAPKPDGPQNLADAIVVAMLPSAHGVMAVCAGRVHAAAHIKKVHTHRLNAFSSGNTRPLAIVQNGRVQQIGPWPDLPVNSAPDTIKKIASLSSWPRVEIVMNYADADGWLVDSLLQTGPDPLRGLVVAATGNGTVHQNLEAALRRAVRAGVRVVLSTRCDQGRVDLAPDREFENAGDLSPVKARVALMLELM